MKIGAVGLAVGAAIGATITSSASAATFFEATLSGGQVVPPFNTSAGGVARFELNSTQTELSYFIQLDGLTLKPDIFDRTELNDVTRIHLHTAPVGENGPHVLNIFGLPSEDDDDLTIDFSAGTLSGVWDNSDAIDPTTGSLFDQNAPGTTKLLSDFVDELLAGEVYLQIHTLASDTPPVSPGELRGQTDSSSRTLNHAWNTAGFGNWHCAQAKMGQRKPILVILCETRESGICHLWLRA